MITIEQIKKNLLQNCANMSLNICPDCPSKKQCCKLAYQRFNSRN